MQVAIITVAGVSSRFNQGIEEGKRRLKAIYTDAGQDATLLRHMLERCKGVERIIVVGGYQYGQLCDYVSKALPEELQQKI